jgi:hypothetical protein
VHTEPDSFTKTLQPSGMLRFPSEPLSAFGVNLLPYL